MYGTVVVVCVGLLAFFSMPVWAGIPDKPLDLYLLTASAGVAAYSVQQMLHPVPQRIRVARTD